MGVPRTSVLSLGNILMGDDAFGPTVAAHLLARYELPEAVEVVDLGTPGLDLHPFLAEPDVVILVDTVRADAPAGGLRVYDMDDIRRHPPGPRVSPHDPGLKEALMGLEFEGTLPDELILVATVPDDVGMEVGLSDPVQAAVSPACERIVEELRQRGFEVRERTEPGEPDLWWVPGAPPRDSRAVL